MPRIYCAAEEVTIVKCEKILSLSIKWKITISVYLIIVILFLIIITSLTHFADKDARAAILSSAERTVHSSYLLIEKEKQYLKGFAEYYAIDTEVQEVLKDSNSGKSAHALSDSLITVIRAKSYVLGFNLYNSSGKCISSMSIDNSYGPVDQDIHDYSRPIYKLLSGKRAFVWEYIDKGETIYLEGDYSPKLCLWYVIKDNYTFRPIGVLSLTLDSRKLIGSQSISDNLNESLMLINDDGRIIYSLNGKSVQMTTNDGIALFSHVDLYSHNGNFTLAIDNTDYYVIYEKVSGAPFIVFLLIPDKPFWGTYESIFVASIVSILIGIIFFFPLLLMLSSTLTQPLNILMESMRRYSHDNTNIHVNFKHNDEIGKLGRIFNTMVDEHNKLIENNYILKIKKQSAELAVMQAHINPHFIYNILNHIQWTALDLGANDIAHVTHALGHILHASLSSQNGLITIGNELDITEYYVSLQKKRHKNNIKYKVCADPDIMQIQIPKLIIQPVVENSIIHGLKSSASSINISVSIEKLCNGRLIIIISDDGVGIDEKTLKSLPNHILPPAANTPGNHFALKNIYDRLTLHYGENNFTFTMTSEYKQWTKTKIEIPDTILFDLNQQ